MNALLGIRHNMTGQLGPTTQQRREVAQEVQGMMRARKLGALRALGMVPKTATLEDVAAAEKSGGTAEKTTASRQLDQDLGKDAFLQLLVLQMRHQDPLDPMDNSQMIAQLAQFSSLEQMNNLNDSFQELSGNVDQLNFISANSLLGREVNGVDLDGQQVSGVVQSVHLNGSVVYLAVGEQMMSMAGVIGIEQP